VAWNELDFAYRNPVGIDALFIIVAGKCTKEQAREKSRQVRTKKKEGITRIVWWPR
jgi:hypothetical protein